MAEAWYYSQLNKEKRQAYHAIREGLLSLAPSFAVPLCEPETFTELFTKVRLDCPEIFYAVGFSYRFYRDAASAEFIPEYLFKKKQIQEHQKAIAARVQKLVRQAAGLDEAGRELFVHDFICRNVLYDKLEKPYSHEVIGPLTQGVGVCEGISKTVKLLCNELGIPCVIAFSHDNPEKGIRYRHAWNVVTIGGKTYHLDATFDNTLSANGEIRYDYYNLPDAALFRDHEPLIWPVPSCSDSARMYYRTAKLSFTKYEEVRSRAAQALKKNRTLVFHWRGGYLTREVLNDLCGILSEEASARGRHVLLSLNWAQAVLCVSFPENEADAGVRTETVYEE